MGIPFSIPKIFQVFLLMDKRQIMDRYHDIFEGQNIFFNLSWSAMLTTAIREAGIGQLGGLHSQK